MAPWRVGLGLVSDELSATSVWSDELSATNVWSGEVRSERSGRRREGRAAACGASDELSATNVMVGV